MLLEVAGTSSTGRSKTWLKGFIRVDCDRLTRLCIEAIVPGYLNATELSCSRNEHAMPGAYLYTRRQQVRPNSQATAPFGLLVGEKMVYGKSQNSVRIYTESLSLFTSTGIYSNWSIR